MSRLTRHRSLLASLAALALFAPATARADQGAAVIQDCLNHNSIQGHYSQQAYSQALAELPADVTEYSDCANLIRQARLAAASSRSTGSGPGGPFTSGGAGGPGGSPGAGAPLSISSAERSKVALAGRNGGGPLNLGEGGLVQPGGVHRSLASAVNSLPTPLLAVLAALGACAVLAGARVVRDLVRTRGWH